MNLKTGNSSVLKSWAIPLIKGMIFGGFITLILLVLAALVLSLGALPLGASFIMASLAVAFGGFFGGLISAKKLGQKGLICGMLCGFFMFLLLSVVSLIAFQATPGVSTLTRLIIYLLAGAIGGIIGVDSAAKRKIV